MMNEVMDFESALKNECVESLMLVSIFGEKPYRQQALQELQQRRLLRSPELLAGEFMTNLGVIF
jgi:hypothetical protein